MNSWVNDSRLYWLYINEWFECCRIFTLAENTLKGWHKILSFHEFCCREWKFLLGSFALSRLWSLWWFKLLCTQLNLSKTREKCLLKIKCSWGANSVTKGNKSVIWVWVNTAAGGWRERAREEMHWTTLTSCAFCCVLECAQSQMTFSITEFVL